MPRNEKLMTALVGDVMTAVEDLKSHRASLESGLDLEGQSSVLDEVDTAIESYKNAVAAVKKHAACLHLDLNWNILGAAARAYFWRVLISTRSRKKGSLWDSECVLSLESEVVWSFS